MAVLVAFKKLGHLASYAADVRWAPCQGAVCICHCLCIRLHHYWS